MVKSREDLPESMEPLISQETSGLKVVDLMEQLELMDWKEAEVSGNTKHLRHCLHWYCCGLQ
jgi:hypothetical protein